MPPPCAMIAAVHSSSEAPSTISRSAPQFRNECHFGSTGYQLDQVAPRPCGAVGVGMSGVSCSPYEPSGVSLCGDLNLHGHHNAQRLKHLVLIGLDVHGGPGRKKRQLDLHRSHEAVGPAVAAADEGAS